MAAARPAGPAHRFTMGVVFVVVTVAQGQADPVCAPLQGTARYSACLNDQLSRRRTGPSASSPAPVVAPDFLGSDPDLDHVFTPLDLSDETQRAGDVARRESDLRSNLLRQQVQRDLGPGTRQPRQFGQPVPPLTPVSPLRIWRAP